MGFPDGELKWELTNPSPWITTQMLFVEDTKMTSVIQEHFFLQASVFAEISFTESFFVSVGYFAEQKC